MKAYVITTGILFGVITVAHIWRAISENRFLASDPWYIAITLLTAGLAVWSWRVIRSMKGS